MILELKKLNCFLRLNNHVLESVIINDMIQDIIKSAANNTMVIPPQDTVVMSGESDGEFGAISGRKKLSSSESVIDFINNAGIGISIELIKFIAGTEAGSKGIGKLTAEGNIYEVVFNGQNAIAKILPLGSPEPDIWNFILNMPLTREERRHLPRIFDIIPAPDGWVIIMEKLEPYSAHIRSVLKGDAYRQSSVMSGNEEYLYDIINRTFNFIIPDLESVPNNEEEKKLFNKITENIEDLKMALEKQILVHLMKKDKIFDFMKSNLIKIKNSLSLSDSVDMFINHISDYISKKINLYLTPSRLPIPKYFSTEPIDSALEQLERKGISNRKRKRLENERDTLSYMVNPETYYYSENYMPETKSLFSLIKKMKENGLEWSDLHTGNIMRRSGTNDLVIIDVGLYNIK